METGIGVGSTVGPTTVGNDRVNLQHRSKCQCMRRNRSGGGVGYSLICTLHT